MKRIILSLICATLITLAAYGQRQGRDITNAVMLVAEQVGDSVVSISAEVTEKLPDMRRFYFGQPFEGFGADPFGQFFEEFFGSMPDREFDRMGLGSGVIIDEEGYILTNEHVVSSSDEIKVKLSDGREFDAEIKGSDKRSDLAVIKIDAKNLPVARMGDSSDLKIGEWVVAIGNPFGFAIENPEPTVTVGVISALDRYIPALGARDRSYDDLIQTDAAINPGNSGGPLVDLDGKIIGINTAIITTTGGYQGLGFAIPVKKANRIVNKLIKGEKILYGWLGVSIQDLNDDLRNYFGVKEREGVIVVKVFKDSPAQKAKIEEGDLILTFEGQSVKTTRDLVRAVSSAEVGSKATLGILRKGKEVSSRIKIGTRPEDIDELEGFEPEEIETFRGMEVDDISEGYRQRYRIRDRDGVVITYIEENSPADDSGLTVGDVITRVEHKRVRNKEDFISIIEKVKGSCLLKTNRGYFVVQSEE